MSKHEILIVDDEIANLQKLKRTFLGEYVVHEAATGDEALALLRDHPIAAIITDQRMPGISGVNLLRQSLEIRPDAVRIILTGYTEVEYLMDAINQGQVHRYITKPWEPIGLREAVRQELERWELKKENERLAEQLRQANERLEKENFRLRQEMELLDQPARRLVYRSQEMSELMKLLDRVVPTNSTVLIQGETGTGKELIARYIHDNSPRADQPFVAVNCGAIPTDLIESAFFGHKKGSFTGAIENRKGHFELAHQGTLFLDEIGEAPLDLQVKMLRVASGWRNSSRRRPDSSQDRRSHHRLDKPDSEPGGRRGPLSTGSLLPSERVCGLRPAVKKPPGGYRCPGRLFS